MQPGYWIADKKERIWKSPYLWYHVLLTGLVAWLFLFDARAWWVVAIITGTHLVVDGLKLWATKRLAEAPVAEFRLFVADQVVHLLVLWFVWLAYIDGWHRMHGLLGELLPGYRILLRAAGYLVVTGPVGFIIHYMTRRWMNEINISDSLKDAGRWIGMLERILIITFIYVNQFSAIGFLIAAKSILRLTDKPEKPAIEGGSFSPRKHTEYVLIGTFMSFGIAILTGLLINWLLHW